MSEPNVIEIPVGGSVTLTPETRISGGSVTFKAVPRLLERELRELLSDVRDERIHPATALARLLGETE